MRKVIVIETAEELVEFANPNRAEDDDRPFLDRGVTLVIDNSVPFLQDEQCKFQLSSSVTEEDIFNAMAKACHLKIRLT